MIKFRSRPIRVPKIPEIERELNSFRIAVEDFVRQLNQCPLVDGNLIQDIELTAASTNRVYHKLERIPQGWIVTRVQETYSQHRDVGMTDTYIDIYSYRAATIDIWVF